LHSTNKIVSFFQMYTPEQQKAWFKDKIPNLQIDVVSKTCPLGEVCDMVSDADIILHVPGIYIAREMLEAAKKVKLVQFISVGYDNIDLKAATDLGIPVANNPGFPSIPVAEHTVMSILVLLKQAAYTHSELFKGNWNVQSEVTEGKIGELTRKTVGILGLGNIGIEVAKRLKPFGPKIIYNKRNRLSSEDEEALGIEYADFNELIAKSDIVTIHMPLTPETKNIISRDQIAKMKPGSYIINTARGPLVDEAAVADALREGKLAGAAFDVPRYAEGDVPKLLSTFAGIKNILITPHTSSSSPESEERCVQGFTTNVERVFRGEKPMFIVNGVEGK
jgi:lactate dehydrogenase-like 2-hydroxyacid dehydrogenase